MKRFNQQEAVDEQSGGKRECFIAIGDKRVRCDEAFHNDVTEFCRARNYSKAWDAIQHLARIGAKLLRMTDGFYGINVHIRAAR